MNQQFLIDASGLERAKERYGVWRQQGFPQGDANIIAICEQFASLEGVVPVMSCEGHEPHDRGLRKNVMMEFQVILVANEEGMCSLLDVYAAALQGLWNKHRSWVKIGRPASTAFRSSTPLHSDDDISPTELSLVYLFRPWVDGTEETEDILTSHYPAVCLRAGGTTRTSRKMNFIRLLETVLSEQQKEQR